MELEILEKFRDIDDPELSELNGNTVSILSKDECVEELKKRKIDALKLCKIGGIDPRTENLCKILHFAMELEASTSKSEEPPKKKKKEQTSDVSNVYAYIHTST